MRPINKYLGSFLLAAAIAAPIVITGCEAQARYYDEDHHDYHHWNRGEDRAYHFYVSDRHVEFREYRNLNKDEQRDYWRWRHDHPHSY
jgi:hypothetical protein